MHQGTKIMSQQGILSHMPLPRLVHLPHHGINHSSLPNAIRSASSKSRPSHVFRRGYVCSSEASVHTLRLMPLGGSITRGVGSSNGTGYRKALMNLLKLHDINAQMVGSRKDGSMDNNDHEGWRGFRIDEIEKKAKQSVGRLSPDVFLVNAGSNDCLQTFQIQNAGNRLGEMLEYLWTCCPQSTVLFSTLVGSPNQVVDSTVVALNEQIRALANRKAAEEKRIVLVDMHTKEGPDVQDLVDGIHPSDAGYDRMAHLWLRGLQKAQQARFLDLSKYK